MIGMSPEQVRTLCLEVGNLIRACAVWGMDRTQAVDTELSERSVHYFLGEVLKAALGRDPHESEVAIVWET